MESGLEEGQRVIVQGQDKVKPGQKVTPAVPAEKGPASVTGALEAPGSSRIPDARGAVDDAPAPVFPKQGEAGTPAQKETPHD